MSKVKNKANYVPVTPNDELTPDGLLWLNAKTLGEIDNGFLGLCIDSAIKKAAADLDDRGSDGKPRVVVIEIAMTRVGEDDEKIESRVNLKLPPQVLKAALAQNRGDGRGRGMAFRALNPERYDQPTIMDKGYDGKDEAESDDDGEQD